MVFCCEEIGYGVFEVIEVGDGEVGIVVGGVECFDVCEFCGYGEW